MNIIEKTVPIVGGPHNGQKAVASGIKIGSGKLVWCNKIIGKSVYQPHPQPRPTKLIWIGEEIEPETKESPYVANRGKLEKLGFKNILELCLDLHMSMNGSSDPWENKKTKEAIAVLKERLSLWQESLPMSKDFDEAVKSVVLATIKEWQG